MNKNTKRKIIAWVGAVLGIISSSVLFIILWKKPTRLFSNPEEVIPKIKLPEVILTETPISDPSVDSEMEKNPINQISGKKDDLKKIEGIGPKISQLLNEHEIKTFAALNKTNIEDLKKILAEANIRIADPTTWAEQAAYAVKEDWVGLHYFQQELKGGRR